MLSGGGDDLAYSLDPVLWAKEVLGYHPDPWQADLLRSRSRKIILRARRSSSGSPLEKSIRK